MLIAAWVVSDEPVRQEPSLREQRGDFLLRILSGKALGNREGKDIKVLVQPAPCRRVSSSDAADGRIEGATRLQQRHHQGTASDGGRDVEAVCVFPREPRVVAEAPQCHSIGPGRLTGCAGMPPATSTTSIASTTTTTEPLTVNVTVSPDHVVTGTMVTFTVEIRGPGTGDGESVRFGDGGTSGANAGMIKCGDTARADRTGTYPHSYAAPGTYQFSDEVEVIGLPPSCAREDVTGTATVVVASPLQSATSNGAFLSPTRNIACLIDITANELVRCATFSPTRLVTMTATGSLNTCSGSQCELGNPSPDTPTLAYGTATGAGPFQCVSTVSAVTCTVAGGKGFTISRSGIEQIGE